MSREKSTRRSRRRIRPEVPHPRYDHGKDLVQGTGLPYTFSEVAELVGLPEATVKNWTFGRPLAITPSVSTGGGQGSRSLYSLYDVWRFAVARELVAAGFAPRAIQPVIDQLTDVHLSRCYDYGAISIIRARESPDLLTVEFLAKPDIELDRVAGRERRSIVVMAPAEESRPSDRGLPDRKYFTELSNRGITGAFILDLSLIVAEIDYRDAEIEKRREARTRRARARRATRPRLRRRSRKR